MQVCLNEVGQAILVTLALSKDTETRAFAAEFSTSVAKNKDQSRCFSLRTGLVALEANGHSMEQNCSFQRDGSMH